MNPWLSMSPYVKPLLGVLAVVFAFFLVKFLIRQAFAVVKFLLVLGLLAIGALFYLDYTGYFGSAPPSGATDAAPEDGAESEAEQTTARQIFAQIVDAEERDQFSERAILERRPYNRLLKAALKASAEQLRKATNDRTFFESLTDEPDIHRCEPYFAGRGVILEISDPADGKEYGLPGGTTVLPGIFVNTAHEVFPVRIVCPAGSTLRERLKKAIETDQLPVMMVSGFFFKNYARKTGDEKEVWVKPLLVCPEPETPAKKEEPRQALAELQAAGYAHLLPSKRIEAPAARERLVVDVTLGQGAETVRAWGESLVSKGNAADIEFLKKALAKLKSRLPADEIKDAAAVLNVTGGGEMHPRVQALIKEMKALGVSRISVKSVGGANSINPGK